MKSKTEIPKTGSIPTKHETIDPATIPELSVWIDEMLEALEAEFEAFVTPANERTNIDAR